MLAPVSRRYLRDMLRESGVLLEPLVEGVRQEDLAQLERTLKNLQSEYEAAGERGDTARQQLCRKAVLEARQHARWALRRHHPDAEFASLKEEMIAWMLVWLENPAIFTLWSELRLRERAGGEAE